MDILLGFGGSMRAKEEGRGHCPKCFKAGMNLLSERSISTHGKQTLCEFEGHALNLLDMSAKPLAPSRSLVLIGVSLSLFVAPLVINSVGAAYPGGWCSQLGTNELAGWSYWGAVMGMEVGWVKRMMGDSEQMQKQMWLARSRARIDEVRRRIEGWSGCMECELMWPDGEASKSREWSGASMRALAEGGEAMAAWEAFSIEADMGSQATKRSASKRL